MKIGIISDIHEDIFSLKGALKAIEKANCDEIVCLGDIVGFGLPQYDFFGTRDAGECLDLVKSVCDHVLLGNHDLYAIRKLPEYTAGFDYPDDWYELDFINRKDLADGKLWLYEDSELSALLTHADRAYLDSLTSYGVVSYEGVDLLLSHFVFPDIAGTRREKPSTAKDLERHFEFVEYNGCSMSFCGHGHLEGMAIGTPEEIQYFPFGEYQLENKMQGVIGPCIAKGERQNGFMVFDTGSLILDVMKLG